ncbi:triose-phosphate isomerase [soil metagenome]
MSRKFIIAANWKMHMVPQETEEFLRPLMRMIGARDTVDIVICPPFVSLAAAKPFIAESTNVALGAQHMNAAPAGAHTGEISARMLRDLYCTFVILGHSERRSLYGETDESINKKMLAAHESRLKPIFCVGETLEQREQGLIEDVLTRQLTTGLAGIGPRRLVDTVIAYEPVWAIGTGRTATPDQAQSAHAFIRSKLAELYDPGSAEKVRIQYGGSVKPSNTVELMSQPDIDGALVGGASLESGSFYEIIKGAIQVTEDQET